MDEYDNNSTGSDEAANLARAKLQALYGQTDDSNSQTVDHQQQPQPTHQVQPAQAHQPAQPLQPHAENMPPNHQVPPNQPTYNNAPQARSSQGSGANNAFHLPAMPAGQSHTAHTPHPAPSPAPPSTPSLQHRSNNIEPPTNTQADQITELYEREQTLQQEAQPLQRSPSLPDHQLQQSQGDHTLPGAQHANAFQLPRHGPTTHNPEPIQTPNPLHTPPVEQNQAPSNTQSSMREQQIAQHNQNQQPSRSKHSLWDKVKDRWHHFVYGDDITPGHGKAIVRALIVSLLLVVFYNHQIIYGQIQYYISPGNQVVSPAIIDPSDSQNVGEDPRIVIPKINVDVPVVYDITSWADADVQKGLERGVVHYGTTALPGEIGNNVIVGHSSNSVWTAGKYKFAFVLLDQLDDGDTFILDYKGERYIYEVFNKEVIEPTDVEVLSQDYDEPITTLITCTPPGTAWRRLIVQARQISPNPANAEAPKETKINNNQAIPGDTKSFVDTLRDIFN